MIGDKKDLKTCQGGDCKVFEERKVYNTTLKSTYDSIKASYAMLTPTGIVGITCGFILSYK